MIITQEGLLVLLLVGGIIFATIFLLFVFYLEYRDSEIKKAVNVLKDPKSDKQDILLLLETNWLLTKRVRISLEEKYNELDSIENNVYIDKITNRK